MCGFYTEKEAQQKGKLNSRIILAESRNLAARRHDVKAGHLERKIAGIVLLSIRKHLYTLADERRRDFSNVWSD